MSKRDFALFSVIGIEIEYMLVNKETLDVCPKSDTLLADLGSGNPVNELILGEIALSNELVMHVIEFKNHGPRPPMSPINEQFQHVIDKIQPWLQQNQLQLLPTGAHPWMDPHTECVRWPHGNRDIYQQYNLIFDCNGHGWGNLQSMHVNLPFSNNEEFGALHNTLRLLLPLLPALAASTPLLDGQPTTALDTRLSFYESNQQKIPSIAGAIVPDFITSEAEYLTKILVPMYQAIAPFDPDEILQEEWLNSRGVIPKFDYGALEVRILDSQECVNHDIAIARVIHTLAQHWCEQGYYPTPPAIDTKILKHVYDQTIQHGFNVEINDPTLLKAWQLPPGKYSVREVWQYLLAQINAKLSPTDQTALNHILTHGNLSERILRACNADYRRAHLQQIYQQLADCLRDNNAFDPS